MVKLAALVIIIVIIVIIVSLSTIISLGGFMIQLPHQALELKVFQHTG